MTYRIQLEVFEGPLELLFHLLEKEEIDIRDISLSRITEQYLAYLLAYQELDLETAGEFLLMIATLLLLKARTLLPGQEESGEEVSEIDDGKELIQRLTEYRRFRQAAQALEESADGRRLVFPRPRSQLPEAGPPVYTNPIGNVTVEQLASAFRAAMASWQERQKIHRIKPRPITLHEKIDHVFSILQRQQRITFHHLFRQDNSREEIVLTLLAVLEIVRQGKAMLQQVNAFGPIEISCREGEGKQGEATGSEGSSGGHYVRSSRTGSR